MISHLKFPCSCFKQGFTLIAESICKNVPEHVPALVEYFEPVLKKVYDTQRSVAAAMYAEFINQQCAGDLSLMNRLKNGLLAKLVDPSHCKQEEYCRTPTSAKGPVCADVRFL
jgi:hypothetical protein